MRQYLVVEIENLEPLKIGAGGNKTGPSEPAKEYIPGSTLRGAMIAQLIKSGHFTDETGPGIVKSVACYNAYPYRNGHLFLPAPQHLRLDKHEWRQKKIAAEQAEQAEQNEQYEQVVRLSNLLEGDTEHRNGLAYRYVAVKNNQLVGAAMPKFYTLHHSTSKKTEEKERDNLFNYQAIRPGQCFRSVLAFDEQRAFDVSQLFGNKEGIRLYLGGSKGSGYGLCQARAIGEVQTSYHEVKQLLGLAWAESSVASGSENGFESSSERSVLRRTLTVTCLSDCIFRDEHGQPINRLPERYLQHICGISVKLTHAFISSGISEGYNVKWGARYPKEATLKAGSVLHYELEQELSEVEWAQACERLEQRLLGMRTQDGFGWLAVNLAYPHYLRVKEEKLERHAHTEEDLQPLAHEAAAAAQVMKVLRLGFGEAKGQWLRMLVMKAGVSNEQQPGDGLNQLSLSKGDTPRSHLRNMLNELKESIDQLNRSEKLQPGSSAQQQRLYRTDKKIISIADCNFATIINFLLDKVEPAANARLASYADTMLRSSSGKLYYEQSAAGHRLFIAELLHEALYYLHRIGR